MTAELNNSASSEFGGYFNSLEKFGGIKEVSKIDKLLSELNLDGLKMSSNTQNMGDNFSFQQGGMNSQLTSQDPRTH